MEYRKDLLVAAGILFRDGKVLVGRRSPNKLWSGYWEFPGGKVESGETPEDTVRRELKEELNIEASVGSLVAEGAFEYPTGPVRIMIYRVLSWTGDFVLKDHDQIDWISLDNMNNHQFLPGNFFIIPALKSALFDR